VPSFHCLYLDPDASGDGRLTANDIMQSDLRGVDLVTLSACETALGRVDLAGNPRGLPAAVLAAGARTVVATLWPVRPSTATTFFTAFYRALSHDPGKREAFRAAQLACRAQHPAFADWGAFTYIGDWS
jgi:CHAT domain-containing protein